MHRTGVTMIPKINVDYVGIANGIPLNICHRLVTALPQITHRRIFDSEIFPDLLHLITQLLLPNKTRAHQSEYNNPKPNPKAHIRSHLIAPHHNHPRSRLQSLDIIQTLPHFLNNIIRIMPAIQTSSQMRPQTLLNHCSRQTNSYHASEGAEEVGACRGYGLLFWVHVGDYADECCCDRRAPTKRAEAEAGYYSQEESKARPEKREITTLPIAPVIRQQMVSQKYFPVFFMKTPPKREPLTEHSIAGMKRSPAWVADIPLTAWK